MEEAIKLGQSNGNNNSKLARWQIFWGKIKREKDRFFHPTKQHTNTTEMKQHVHVHVSNYNRNEYTQNFDQGPSWYDPDSLTRSFSTRFSDPTRINLQRTRTTTPTTTTKTSHFDVDLLL
ncbi:hypothetical protein ACFE04_011936 [Oxalis oulophora]